MKGYNGHKNYNHWNVALWIANDEYWYNVARRYIRRYGKDGAARMLVEQELPSHTPDGVKFTKTAVRAALVEL